jgi:GNAT superfamily N-acetyltransferase
MTFKAGTKRVMMIRLTLEAIPKHPLPSGYRVAWYQPGDERHWLAIKVRADAYHQADAGYFWQTYGAERDQLALRQAYLYGPDDSPLGTLTAWFEDLGGWRYGKVNWMLLLPEAQGRGLSKPLLTTVCARLAELGHQSALLYTLTARLPAINLYQQFGFVPLIRDQHDIAAWGEANPHLRRPFTPDEYQWLGRQTLVQHG